MYKLCLVLLIVTTTLAFPQKKKGNVDELIEEIFGPENPQNKKPTSTTEVNLEAEIDKIFGSDASKKPPATSTTKPDHHQKTEVNLEAEIDKIFGSNASKKPPVTSTTKPDHHQKETGKECFIVDQPGVCVKYYLCENVFTVNPGVIDIAGGQDFLCESYLDVCCRKDDILTSIP